MSDKKQSGRKVLLLITVIFVAPIFFAMYMYYSDSNWRPAISTHRGQLITPVRTFPDISITNTTDAKNLYGTWSLLVLATDQCDALCADTLIRIRQIRLSLGPKMPRLQTLYLPAQHTEIPQNILEEHPALNIIEPQRSESMREIVGEFTNGEVFIIDPLGNLMMRYTPEATMSDIRKDLGQLLKLSGIG
jgi:hypothetical protein